MERRNLLVGLLVLVLSCFLLAGTAFAKTTKKTTKKSDPPGACVVHSQPSFIDQGFGSAASSVADVIEVECESVYAEYTVKVQSQQLYNRCDDHLYWTAISNGEDPAEFGGSSPSIGWVTLDNDGNATVVALGGPSCASGESIISAHLEEAPSESTFTSFDVLAPKVTGTSVMASPSSQVEVGNYNNVATIIGAEFPSAFSEKPIAVSDEQLYSKCDGYLQWYTVGVDGPVDLGDGESETLYLDSDGNAFAVALGGPSCASGVTEVEASLEKAPYTTKMSTFTVLAPEETF
jgi:hypothetical protein